MSDEKIIAVDAASALMPAVFAVRHQVFVIEQQVPPELERDEFDAIAVHLVALHGDDVVGTVRIVVGGGGAKIGRLAVLAMYRRAGIGSRLMARTDAIVRDMGARDVTLHAQLTAKAFYTRLGYCEEGEIFEEAGILHVGMRKRIV